MSVRSFLAPHLCWQPTALLQPLQSLKPAAALAGMPFLVPFPPISPPLYNFLCLDQRNKVTKPDWAPSTDKEWILKDDSVHVFIYIFIFFMIIFSSSLNFKQTFLILKGDYFSDVSYCQNTKKQAPLMQGRQQHKSRQTWCIWTYMLCHFTPWNVVLFLLAVKIQGYNHLDKNKTNPHITEIAHWKYRFKCNSYSYVQVM